MKNHYHGSRSRSVCLTTPLLYPGLVQPLLRERVCLFPVCMLRRPKLIIKQKRSQRWFLLNNTQVFTCQEWIAGDKTLKTSFCKAPFVNDLEVLPVEEVAGTWRTGQHYQHHVPDHLLLLPVCHRREPFLQPQLPLPAEQQQEAHLERVEGQKTLIVKSSGIFVFVVFRIK